MSYFRRDDFVDAAIFGYSIPNIAVTYLMQPGLTPATVYANATGAGGAVANPQFTDGLGHAVAYVAAGTYTIIYSGEQIQTMTLPDQSIGGAGGSSVTFFAGVPSGAIDGVNRVFTFAVPSDPLQFSVWLNFPLIVNVGYTASWATETLTIVYAVAPQAASGSAGSIPADSVYVQGAYES